MQIFYNCLIHTTNPGRSESLNAAFDTIEELSDIVSGEKETIAAAPKESTDPQRLTKILSFLTAANLVKRGISDL